MPRALLRKLTDTTSGEDLASIKEMLESKRIPVEFHIMTHGKRSDFDCYRIYVYVAHLQQARQILAERRTQQAQAIFEAGRKMLENRA